MSDLISVIVIIYRVEKYLTKCIESIVNQSYKNLEIILVDDGSDDGCSKICDEYTKLDKRIKVIHKKNGGMYEARKTGIIASSGRFIGYVDGDDWVEQDMYESLYNHAVKNNVEVVESGVIDSCGDREKRRVSVFKEGCYLGDSFNEIIGPRLVYSGKFFSHGVSPYLVTKLFKRDAILKYQLKEELGKNILDDVMCTFPCIIESRSIYITHECFYHYRVRMDSAKRIFRDDIVQTVKSNYKYLIARFEGRHASDYLEKQIEYFVMYLLLAKAPAIFDTSEKSFILNPYGKIPTGSKLIIYGAGTVGINLNNYISKVNKDNLVLWVDKNFDQMDKKLNIHSPECITQYEYDYIVIAILAEEAVSSAWKELLEMGVPDNKILWISDKYVKEPIMLLKKAENDGEEVFQQSIKQSI